MPKKVPDILMPNDPAIVGYLAGLIDGEGYLGISSSFNKKHSLQVSYAIRVAITSTSETLMDWLGETVGSDHRRTKHIGSERWAQSWDWVLHGKNAERFLEAIIPYLVIKKEQAELLLKLRQTQFGDRVNRSYSDEQVADREAIKARIHVLNARGPKVA